jgi:CheY-like chemotaxis protein
VAVGDFAMKRLLQSFFQNNKFKNYQVFDSGVALIQAISGSKDRILVFYDLEMSDKNGLELLATVRKAGDPQKNLMIVLVTGQLNSLAHEKLTAAGANALLARPVNQDALVGCLKDIKLFC